MDARSRRSLGWLLVSALWAGSGWASAQKRPDKSTGKTVRKVRVVEEDISVAPAVIQAETAIEKRDLPKAEELLLKVVELDPRDYRAWFDLGYVFSATGRKARAIDAYRKSLAIKPTVQEANLSLGLLLAAEGSADAAKYLRAATTLKPDSKDNTGTFRAWLALGNLLQASAPQEAIHAFSEAARLHPNDPEPRLALGRLQEKTDPKQAESEYKAALALNPQSTDAMAGLVNLYTASDRLAEAETFLRDYLKREPQNNAASLQLGKLLVKAGKPEEALPYFEAGLKAKPNDPELLRAVASLHYEAKQYPEAEERYRAIVQASPQDSSARRSLAVSLMKQRKFPEAEAEFMQAIRLAPKEADNYADLAVVAAQNKKYELAIRALDERAKYAAEMPATYFLRATSYDNLRAFKEAAENYRQFLAVADGRFPDQEWQARHRLIAIEPKK